MADSESVSIEQFPVNEHGNRELTIVKSIDESFKLAALQVSMETKDIYDGVLQTNT